MRAQNTLFIFSDEHNRDITGCYGNSIIQTPNLDRLAANGTQFTSAYTNCPICVPARASLATGQYIHQLRAWDNAHPYVGEPRSFGHRLMQQDHHVSAIGKLHYRDVADDTGWSEEIDTLHVLGGTGNISGSIRTNMRARSTAKKLAEDAGPGDSSYLRYDTSTTKHALKWLRDEAPKHTDKPWTLFLGYVLPHFPLVAPPEYFAMYPDLPPPRMANPSEWPDHPVIQELIRVQAYNQYFDDERTRVARQAYFGMISYLDYCIGQVLEALDTSGLGANTRIVYTSDHGDNIGHRGLWGKSNMYEESAAIPMIISGADIPKGHVVDAPVSLVDCYPTLLEGAGVALTDSEQETLPGTSLLRIANNEIPARTVLSEYHASGSSTGMFMIRNGKWKYVHYVGERPQLFDLAADPHETTDHGTSTAHVEVLAECEAKLRGAVDPDAVNAQAFADQAALIELNGGREAVLGRGDIGYTPAPGETAHLT